MLLLSKWRQVGGQQLTSLAEATLRNAARLVGEDPDRLPGTAAEAQRWLAERFLTVGGLKEHLTRRWPWLICRGPVGGLGLLAVGFLPGAVRTARVLAGLILVPMATLVTLKGRDLLDPAAG